ncbi:MAG: hypothetical protein NVSMB62_24960 [Acidobacteriaceae bacterium]
MTKLLGRLDLERSIGTTRRSVFLCGCRRSLASLVWGAVLLGGLDRPAAADTARFDLTGPKVEVRASRAGMTLPIASVPNLQPGDRLWLHPDLPETQSVRYLMVVVFLRGTTNPPPDNWFVRIETWDKKVRSEGVEVTVPDEAQQAVLFLAPVTGGDFSTLRSAVRGRPGVFVRAAQDLDLAGFEQARIEKYIASMRQVPQAELSDAKALQEHSNVIAGTLALKPNGDCVKLPPDQQYTCLTQSGSQNLLDDGHGDSIVSAISTGPGSDFINAASATSLAGGGVYSAYVGAIVDLVRIMGSLHTAHYQYIPAIAFPDGAALNLRLNAAPSFHNPKSVIVIGLPSIQATSAPPLRPKDPKLVSCLAKPALSLPMEGAPLAFSTAFAHDLVLHINYPEGMSSGAELPQDIPLTPDAYKGGLVLGSVSERRALPIAKVTLPTAPARPAGKDTKSSAAEAANAVAPVIAGELTGTIEGFWGFDTFRGPTVPLQRSPGKEWKLASHEPLIAGKDDHVLLTSTGTACIDTIVLDGAPAGLEKAAWKAADQPNTVDVALKLSAIPGNDPRALKLTIRQFGSAEVAAVGVVSYMEPAKLNGLAYHAGDRVAVLSGTSLDEVKEVSLGGTTFVPAVAAEKGSGPSEALRLETAAGAAGPSAAPGEHLTAKVLLKDGRELLLSSTVEPARPSITLISKADVPAHDRQGPGPAIKLGASEDVPLGDTLTFSMTSTQPFPRDGRLEVASADGGFHVNLTLEAGTLVLGDPHTVVGRLETLKAFGPSAFGPIRVRAVNVDGAAGDWIPLATLVRLPTITGLSCTPPIVPRDGGAPSKPDAGEASSVEAKSGLQSAGCTLAGSNLYLIHSIGTDAGLANAAVVTAGFVGDSLPVPSAAGGQYFLRLRDDPTTTNTLVVPGQP